MRKFLLILVIVFLLILTAPLSSFKHKDNSKHEVIVWTLQMSDFSEYMNRVIKDFESQNPDIKIKWIDVPFSFMKFRRNLSKILTTA